MQTLKSKPKRKPSLASRLRARGFDKSYYDRAEGYTLAGCSQCQAICVNGVPIHEQGCPNEKRA